MVKPRVIIDRRGVRTVLNSPKTAAEVNRSARRVARKAGRSASVQEYTTDRQAASVRIPAEDQAKHGVLVRAAQAAGLEVRVRRTCPRGCGSTSPNSLLPCRT